MASATARLLFPLHHLTQPCPKPKKPNLFPSHKLLSRIPPNIIQTHRNQPHFTVRSIDVSKEDSQETPTSDPDNKQSPSVEETSGGEATIDKRRLEEKFAVLNTGIYECRSCGFKYDEAVGDPSYPIPPGFQFDKLPDDWRCPTCGAAKSFFESKSVEIAGFAQNQQFGLGGNALTSGQKALLIYGSLFFFFVLFLSGYFLQ
ncbi:hypothetical protein J1N35_023266 [Gossypium stocksii]|uniref:Rubredoxin-like domain-containing protein n=1 Tax=Gossypium stocksii TaxID=47602 RepID=A0A9D3VHX0_9ROSI|nr:hypothetical protein J1N35_023266 [Gossypium stocksii]